MKNKQKQISAVLKAGESDGHTFSATISTNAVDRDGEVLLPEGMDAKDFNANPVVFWNHNYEKPIGRATKLAKTSGGWTAEATLAPRPETHEGEWLPDVAHALIKAGVLNGVSVGFAPVESRRPTKKDLETFGDDLQQVYTRWKLLEFSLTGLPSNQEALVTAVSKGAVSAIQCKAMGLEVPEAKTVTPKRKAIVIVSMYAPPVVKPKVSQADMVQKMVERELQKARGVLWA